MALSFFNLHHYTGAAVSKNTAMYKLECKNNQLANLDLSKNTILCVLFCENNCLTTLDLSNINLRDIDLTKVDLGIYCQDRKWVFTKYRYSPQNAKVTGDPAQLDAAAIVGTENVDRVSDYKATETGAQYNYDVKGVDFDGNIQPKMEVTVEIDNTPAEPTTPETPSTEGTTGFVDRLYSVCLSRPADAAGQADWVKQLTSYQISGTKAAYGFIFSEEFTNMNYSNADFVEHLYEAFMGRASDEGGKADWVGKLDAGTTREEVFNGFANSVEFDNICKSYGIVSKDIETFVTRLYSVCLDRQPDEAGLADWAGRLRSGAVTGKAAASGFVFSEEFTSKNYSNADYVEHLYAAFMGRASDEGGKADWVGKLDAGTTREEVFNGFADSAEFNNICASYGIVRG